MASRLPLAASVVGALLVVGAVTGSTHAGWVGQKSLAAHSVASGAMSVSGSASPSSLTISPGTSGTSVVTVTDTSTTTAKNLRQRITPTVTSTPVGVTATLTTRSGGSCTTTTQPAVTTAPGEAFTSCLNVTASSSAVSGDVVVTLAGAQTPAGWSSSATVTVPVTVNAPAPAAPVLRCNDSQSFNWLAVLGATSYVVSSSSTQSGTYTDIATQTATSFGPVTLTNRTERFYRVRAVNAAGSSPASNTIRIRRDAGYTCTAVSP